LTVVDASAVVEALIGEARGRRVMDVLAAGSSLAPDILDCEALHALKGLERGGLLDEQRAELAVRRLVTAPIRRVSSRSLAQRAWELRHNASLYDAVYVALAQQQDVALLTADTGMADAAARAGVTVTLV
jgi:predicted nucleic acid-binding protein